MEADVIVIGTGGAGIMAAMEAADHGAKVLQLEKMPQLGGCFAFLGSSLTGTQTKIQFDHGVFNDSPEILYADMMRFPRVRAQCQPEVLKFYSQHAGEIVDWVDSINGIIPEMRKPMPGMYGDNWTINRSYGMIRPAYKLLEPMYQRRIDRGDITVITSTEVTQLIEKEGRVCGVVAKGEGGKEINYTAGAVIICTGGFSNDVSLLKRYNFADAETVVTAAPGFARGDGLFMCEKVGAGLVNLDEPITTGPYLGAVEDPEKPGTQIAHVNMNRYPGVIWVNKEGRRVVNEDCGALNPPARDALYASPGKILNVIMDQKIKGENKTIFHGWIGAQERPWEWFDEQANQGVIIKKADTIDELAPKIGIEPAVLNDTITKYNQAVASGEDKEFGRKELDYKIENPPFYAITTGTIAFVSNGGPATNVEQQVMDNDGKLIPGLYAAGEVTAYRGFGTGSMGTGVLLFGKQAGRMAALSLKK